MRKPVPQLIAAIVASLTAYVGYLATRTPIPDSKLKILIDAELKPSDIDPARILLNKTWGYLENLSQPLIEWSPDGELRPGVAESWEWVDNELHLKIREDYQTIDGLKVTADDAAFSLKRLIVLARNTHGLIADFLCGDAKISNINDPCPGISVDGNVLKLKPLKGKQFLVQMLTAMDFVVLLRSEVNLDTLQITSYRNTTGPYYLDDIPNQGLKLLPNKRHQHYSDKIPQEILLIRKDPNRATKDPLLDLSVEMYINQEIDVLQNFTTIKTAQYPYAAKTVSRSTLSPTLSIGRVIAVFTPRGIKELSKERRIAIGKTLRQVVGDKLRENHDQSKPATEFFAPFAEGHLTAHQAGQINETFNSIESEKAGDGIWISVSPNMNHISNPVTNALPLVKFDTSLIDYATGKLKGQIPHLFIVQTDTGWAEDIGLLSYSLATKKFFPGSPEEGKNWLLHYVEIEDKSERLKLLRDLHFRALSEPWIIPIAAEPYYTVTRKPWTYHGPQLFNSGALWHLRRS